MSVRDIIRRSGAVSRKPEGYKLLLAFIEEVEAGKIPRTDTVQRIESAFRKLLFDGAQAHTLPADLRLTWRRGQKPPESVRERSERCGPVWTFISRRLDKASPGSRAPPRGALAGAISAACEHFGKDRTTIQRMWKYYAHTYRFSRENAWALALVDRYVTPEEIEAGKDGPIDPLLALALQRKRAEKAASK